MAEQMDKDSYNSNTSFSSYFLWSFNLKSWEAYDEGKKKIITQY